MAAFSVIALGMFIGWLVRKGTGPRWSRNRSRAPSPPRSAPPPPGPLTPRDPALAGFLAEFASLEGPSCTLLRLQSDLERGRIADFESLAKSLLSHPLEHFREEAMRAVLTAWGRKDPGGALAFLDDYRTEAVFSEFERDVNSLSLANRIASDWGRQDPAAALAFLKERGDAGVAPSLVAGVLSKGPVVERLRLLRDQLGETTMASYLQGWSEGIRSRPPSQLPSSAEWQSLARETRNPQLAGNYAMEALVQKFREAKTPPSAAEAEAWLAEIAPSGLRRQINWQLVPAEMLTTLLPALSPEDFQAGQASWALARLHREHTEAVLGFFQKHGSGAMPSTAFGTLGYLMGGRPESEWAALVALATQPAQREALARGLVSTALAQGARRDDPLGPLTRKLTLLGRDGESAMATLLGELSGESALQVPELFAQTSPQFQEDRRMEVVARLASRSSPTAAELWLGATPEELAQPGAAAVPERIAARFLARDPEAASDWIGRLPPGLGRDRAVARMIEIIGGARSGDVRAVGRHDRGSHRLATGDATPRRTCSSPSILTRTNETP